jgi:hypothetical protein
MARDNWSRRSRERCLGQDEVVAEVLEVLRVQRVLEVLVLKVLQVLRVPEVRLPKAGRRLKANPRKAVVAADAGAAARRRRRWRPA